MNEPPLHALTVDALRVDVFRDARTMGAAAARDAARHLREAIDTYGDAHAIFATASSQRTFYEALQHEAGVDWGRVTLFHMDEYVGLDPTHPASFRHVLRREVAEPLGVGAFHGIEAHLEPVDEVREAYAHRLAATRIDLCCLGIGENGHLAFNDPPFADFEDPEVVKLVELDETSRRQQVGEGHFPDLDAVPTHALTITIPALLDAARVQCVVPETRKAAAVARALQGPIATDCPASILRTAAHAHLYLDLDAASELPLPAG